MIENAKDAVAGIIPAGTTAVGMQLPIQSLSPSFAQPWEHRAGPDELAAIASAADRAGFFYVGVCDHVAVPNPDEIGASWYDTIATLGWLAAQTSTVHLLSHVYVLPYRHPLLIAKAWSTLDLLSGGRAILGAGAGHVAAEFAAMGLDHADRGGTLEESIAALRAAFGAQPSSHVGQRWSFDGVHTAPAAARAGGPPIWIGGSSPAAIRRAAQFGDGWLPQGPPKEGTRAGIARIRELRAAAGLAEVAFDMGVNCEPIYVGTPAFEVAPWTVTGTGEQIAARLNRYPHMGINQLQLRIPTESAGELVEQIELVGREVLPLLNPPANADG